MKEFLIEKIQYSEIDEVAALLTDSFLTNPAYAIIFKKENQRRDGLLWLFKTSLVLNNQKQALTRVVKEKDTDRIIGTFTIVPPQGVKTAFSVYLKIGLPGFIAKLGINSLVRMLTLDDCNKKSLSKSMKTLEYYYLSMVVIKEEFRGRGIGSLVIKYAIQELISSNPVCNLIGLTTQLPVNVAFYSRLGFEKLDEGNINFKGDNYYNYTMKRDL